MKQQFPFLFLLLLLSNLTFSQDYEIGYDVYEGYTSIYKNVPTAADKTKTEKVFGLINDAKKIVIPALYRSLYYAGEKGIFKLKDSKDNVGLFSVITEKFIVEPQYYEIETYSGGLAVVKKRNPDAGFLWGAVGVDGKTVIPIEYEYLGSLKEGLMNFKKAGKTGFLDKNNRVIIPAVYDNFSDFSEGLAAVKTAGSGKFGYIDKHNRQVIPTVYEDATAFYNGYAVVAKKKSAATGSAGKQTITIPGEYLLIDRSGKELFQKTCNRISAYNSGGLFIIELNDKKGVVDSTGATIIPAENSNVTIDKNGYIIYKNPDNKYGLANNRGTAVLDARYDFISQTESGRMYSKLKGMYTVWGLNKKEIVPADSANGVIIGKKRIVYYYDDKVKIMDLNGNVQKTLTGIRLKNYGHSLTVTEDSVKLSLDVSVQLIDLATGTKKTMPFGEAGDFNEEGIFVGKNTTCDFYDHTGKKLNSTAYYTVVNFSEGICALQETSTGAPHLADRNFKKIKDLYTYFKGPFSEGLAYATNGNYGKLYYLDKTGNEVFNISAKEGGKCIAGFIAIKGNDGRFFHVNKKGNPISTKTWEGIGEFRSGIALVKDKGKWGFIDTLGRTVIDCKYDEASAFFNGAAIVKANGSYFLINRKGEPVNNNTYEAAGNPDNGTFPVQKNNLAGLIDSKGNVVIDFKYNSILYMSEERVWAAKDGNWGLLDNKGKVLTGFIYQGAYDFDNGYARVVKDNKIGLVNKAGKMLIPAEYKSLGSVYKNAILGIKPESTGYFSIK